jgi:hypothetical protein
MIRLTTQATLLLTLLTSCGQDYEFLPDNPNVHPGDVTECDFTRVGTTPFYEYGCNPVFSTTGENWAETIKSTAFLVTEVMGHPFYQLWYSGVVDENQLGEFGLGYAISPDGTKWEANLANPLLEEPASSAWDGSSMDAMQVVWDPTTQQYVMLYQGYNLDNNPSTWGLGVATSTDGREWVRLPYNPVVDFTNSSPSDPRWCWPLGLTLGEVAGFTGYVGGSEAGSQKCEVYPINAGDVTQWNPSQNKVYAAGPAGSFDDEGFTSLAIAELDGIHYMFYVGFSDWQNFATYSTTLNHSLGWATSTDGRNWTRGLIPEAAISGISQEAGPLQLRESETGVISHVAAHRVDNRIHMWVTDEWDGNQAVGYYLFDPQRAEEEDAQ